jgi:hypothetical protein
MAFLPVAVPGGQGKAPVLIDPEEVVAIFPNNTANTGTSIVFRYHQFTIQVNAPYQEVLKALQCSPREQTDCCKKPKP